MPNWIKKLASNIILWCVYVLLIRGFNIWRTLLCLDETCLGKNEFSKTIYHLESYDLNNRFFASLWQFLDPWCHQKTFHEIVASAGLVDPSSLMFCDAISTFDENRAYFRTSSPSWRITMSGVTFFLEYYPIYFESFELFEIVLQKFVMYYIFTHLQYI